MMSLIARVSSNVSSSTSVSPVKRSYGNQYPWRTNAEKEERPGRPVVGSDRKTASDYYHEQFIESSSSASYSKWDDNHAWSSQEWKTDTDMCERSGRPDVTSWERHENPNQVSLTRKLSMMNPRNPLNEVIPRERSGRPDVDAHKKEQGHSNLSLETMKQN